MGPIEPGSWQFWHFAWKIGATSFEKVTCFCLLRRGSARQSEECADGEGASKGGASNQASGLLCFFRFDFVDDDAGRFRSGICGDSGLAENPSLAGLSSNPSPDEGNIPPIASDYFASIRRSQYRRCDRRRTSVGCRGPGGAWGSGPGGPGRPGRPGGEGRPGGPGRQARQVGRPGTLGRRGWQWLPGRESQGNAWKAGRGVGWVGAGRSQTGFQPGLGESDEPFRPRIRDPGGHFIRPMKVTPAPIRFRGCADRREGPKSARVSRCLR